MWRLVGTAILAGIMTLGLSGLQTLATEGSGHQTITLRIDGMTCGACVKDVKAALSKVSGVSVVEITMGKKWVVFSDYTNVRASVTFDPERTGVEALIKAIEGAGSSLSAYRARLLEK
jgi:mercuric ion binding protein